uniref:RING-CH-type domain-containing protein n=1 Tax=Ditylenchus dipsaci TaxID=166011 RepID=A0A915EGD9_9BILA
MAELDKVLVETEVNESKFMCKICYDEVDKNDVEESEWISPCVCGGSMKWVHKSCILLWMQSAASNNRTMCGLCRHNYRWHRRIKPVSEWSIPAFDLTLWQITGIFFDAVFTVNFFENLLDMPKALFNSSIKPVPVRGRFRNSKIYSTDEDSSAFSGIKEGNESSVTMQDAVDSDKKGGKRKFSILDTPTPSKRIKSID